MTPISYAAIGALGAGFDEASLEGACERGVTFVGADAGTTDSGPFQLAGQGVTFTDSPTRRDLTVALRVCRRHDVPLLIGSCGGSGRDWGVDWFAELVAEIVEAEGLGPLQVARIYAEPDRDYLKRKLADGRIVPLGDHGDLTDEILDRTSRIVGVMGPEAFVRAIDAGAQVVLAGRSTDAGIWASLPVAAGADPGIAWHAGKVAECGTASAVPPRMDVLRVEIHTDHFIVEPIHDDLRCTPGSVAEHQLYEASDPFVLYEPPGRLDLSQVRYEAASDRAVRVSGARFVEADTYTIKLEGVELVGKQKIFMISVRDPDMLEDLAAWRAGVERAVEVHFKEVFGGDPGPFEVHTRCYGLDGTLGPRDHAVPAVPHEVLFLVDVVAPEDEVAQAIATLVWHAYLHHPSRRGGFSTVGNPFSPPVLDRGDVYRFNLNHIVEVDDPMEMFRMELDTVGALAGAA